MRVVAIENVVPGMILAKPVYQFDDGKILLREDVELKTSYIERLKELQYSHLYIKDPDERAGDLEVTEPVRQETRMKAVSLLNEAFTSYDKNEELSIEPLKETVSEMIDQICENKEVVYNMIDIRSHDSYTFGHSVNVCVLSLLAGNRLGIRHSDLEMLGIGAMLHDIGKIFIDSRILNKPGVLEPKEYAEIKTHAQKGYELLKEKICLSYISAHVAYEHHERNDGSGYPRGLTGDKIHRFAKIVAVADVYDAMTAERVYRRAIPSFKVLNELKNQADTKYDGVVVKIFEQIIAPYPVGSILTLSNGERVLVINVTVSECKVRVIDGINQGKTFNLYRRRKLMVQHTSMG